jgi:Tetracyclin repressor-like, C-terminal domain
VAAAVLDRAEARGDLVPGLDHLLIFQTLIGPMHVRLLLTREPVDAGFLDAVVDLLLAGLTTRSSTPGNTGASPNVTRL